MGDNSCVIHGQHIHDHCKMQAAYLSKLIYKRPPGTPAAGQKPQPFDTSWPEEIAKAEENWEEVEDFDEQKYSGFVARLYKPKGYDFNAKNGDEMCWPTLVFRGTDMEDFYGLGFSIYVRIDALADLIKDIMVRGRVEVGELLQDMEAASYGVPVWRPSQADREKAINNQIARKKEAERQAARERGNPRAEHADKVLVDTTIIMDAAFLENYASQYKGYSREDAEAAGFKPREDIIQIPEIKGGFHLGGEFSGQAEIKAELLGNMQGRTGDWIHNLLQGVGNIEESAQYKRAIEVTMDVMERYIAKGNSNKRLTITGHSLGGGLATAADFTTRYNYYKDNIQIYTLVFNPAGLHENTIRYLKENSEYAKDVKQAHEESLRQAEQDFDEIVKETLRRNQEQMHNCVPEPRLSDAAFNVYRVKDEILTTLEYTPDQIPFLTGAMGILGMRFPKPQGADNVFRAVSPGWTVGQQQTYQPTLESANHLWGIDALHFSPVEGLPPPKKFATMPVLFPLNEQTVVKGQKFPHILALSAIFAKYGKDIGSGDATSFNACLSEMIDYVDNALFDGKLRRYIESKGEDRRVLSLITWKALKEYLSGEIDDLKKIMAICNEYHGMDYVIAAYKNKLQEDARKRQAEAELRRAQIEDWPRLQAEDGVRRNWGKFPF